jgi:hypothetical protein
MLSDKSSLSTYSRVVLSPIRKNCTALKSKRRHAWTPLLQSSIQFFSVAKFDIYLVEFIGSLLSNN